MAVCSAALVRTGGGAPVVSSRREGVEELRLGVGNPVVQPAWSRSNRDGRNGGGDKRRRTGPVTTAFLHASFVRAQRRGARGRAAAWPRAWGAARGESFIGAQGPLACDARTRVRLCFSHGHWPGCWAWPGSQLGQGGLGRDGSSPRARPGSKRFIIFFPKLF